MDDKIVPDERDNAIYMSGYLTSAEICAHLAESCAEAWQDSGMPVADALRRFAWILRATNDEHGITEENRAVLHGFYQTIEGRFDSLMSVDMSKPQ